MDRLFGVRDRFATHQRRTDGRAVQYRFLGEGRDFFGCPALGWSQPTGARDHLAGEVEHLVKAGEQCEGVHERLVRT